MSSLVTRSVRGDQEDHLVFVILHVALIGIKAIHLVFVILLVVLMEIKKITQGFHPERVRESKDLIGPANCVHFTTRV